MNEMTSSTSRDAPEFFLKLFVRFPMIGMDENTFDRADELALMLGVMSDAFGAKLRVDLENLRALGDGAVRAFRFAYVAVDAFIGNHQGHDAFLM
jgi:hypothetical protein